MKRKILVAEDSFEVRVALEMALSQEGYEPLACPDGEAGWQEFKKFAPDLALLDIRMPGMTGIELCRMIRESSNIPVIMFSAIEDKAEKLDAFEAGADDYVVKGTGIDELLIRVAAQLRWKREAAGASGDENETNQEQRPELWEELAEAGRTESQRPGKPTEQTEAPAKKKSKRAVWNKYSRIKVPRFEGKHGTAILVNDPNVEDRERLVRFLERLGEPVIETESGHQTLMTIGRYLPWLVITDLVMPDMNGIDVLKVIYEHPRTANVATMVVSSKGSPQARSIANRYGALDFIVKPWSEDEVSLRIEWARQSLQRRNALENGGDAA